jgi:type II secretory pathway pseudopilin PulG
MRTRIKSLAVIITLLLSIAAPSFAALDKNDAKYAQNAGRLTQEFSDAIGAWGDTYQAAPDKFGSSEYKAWMKKAAAADNAVKAALVKFSKIKVSPGYKRSDLTLRKFIKAYTNAINLYAPAIKKNDEKSVKRANDAILKATALFSTWSNDFAKDSAKLTQ